MSDNTIGWIILVAVGVLSAAYVAPSFDETADNLPQLMTFSALAFWIPGYVLVLTFSYYRQRRLPPRRFIIGATLGWVWVVYLINFRSIAAAFRSDLLTYLIVAILIGLSVWFTRPELEYQLKRSRAQSKQF